ncbi:MAG TPA: NAD-dependent epimerase/dehydratase family protein, partial [Chlamydiales bacterium]|nr:NAD-dependent epimerase/dehydratase family protein [Chlamydiales bacterium]
MKLLIALMLYTGLAFGLERNAKIFVTSQTDMVGSAIVRQLKNRGYDNLLISSPNELDLLDQKAVLQFFEATKPNYVFLTSAKDRQLGSTYGNKTSPAEALSYNLSVQLNVIDAAYRSKVKKLLFISSPSIYPRICSKTIKEDDYLTGPIEPTLEWSGLAKIAGIKLCQAYNLQYGTRFISCVPANFYGPNDDYQEQYYPDLLALI